MKDNLLGRRFGRLVVTSQGSVKNQRQFVVCKCDCGIEREVRVDRLIGSRTKSCGCTRHIRTCPKNNPKHPLPISSQPEYGAWHAAKNRCTNPNNAGWRNYGGRGITMCERWAKSSVAFLKDMGPRPAGHSLERINNDKGYSPDNCVWATRQQQTNNRRTTMRVVYLGQSHSLKSLAELLQVSQTRLYYYHRKMKLSIEDSITATLRSHGK